MKLLLFSLFLCIIGAIEEDDPWMEIPFLEDFDERYSSSVVGLLKLLEIERAYMQAIDRYASVLQQKVYVLQSYIWSLGVRKHEDFRERERFVSNPLNAFALIRRLHQDWPAWQKYINFTFGKAEMQVMENLLSKAPTASDMTEALMGMHRIEKTYDLEPNDIANGRLQGKQYNIQLSKRDCLTLADHKLEKGDYSSAIKWFRIAMQEKCQLHGQRFDEILDPKKEQVETRYLKAIIKYNLSASDNSFNASQLDEAVETVLNNTSTANLKSLAQKASEIVELKSEPSTNDIGCRGLFPQYNKLSCRYNFTTTPFLRLAPLKMEEISINPYIVMYHNIATDEEIEDLHQKAVPKMSNGYAGIVKKNQTEPREIVSRVSWIVDELSSRRRINQRIVDATGLDIVGVQAIQVANYGLGGYFKGHYDYLSDDQIQDKEITEMGDRLASIVIYTGDVEQGGATMFPISRVTVFPQKGNALFWFNLNNDGTRDPRSLHSVCPVIVGSRWTITKWLHEKAQVFRKPCPRQFV